MANIQKLIEREQKERELAEKHKKTADKLRKEIDYLRSQELQKSVTKLNLNSEEYTKFIHVLNNKDSLFEAIELIAADAGLKTDKESVAGINGNITVVQGESGTPDIYQSNYSNAGGGVVNEEERFE